MTRFKLTILLPLFQVIVSAALIASHYLRHDSISDPSWVKPDWQICSALNAPATLIEIFLRKAVDRWLPGHYLLNFLMYYVVGTVGYLLLIALLWYFVSIEVSHLNGEWRSTLTPLTGAPVVVDALLVLVGGAMALPGLMICRFLLDRNLMPLACVIWGIILVLFYGHDLWRCWRTSERLPGSRNIS